MHKEVDTFVQTLGELVRRTRAERMDQSELGKRTGLSRTTISAIERGKGVNSQALFDVLGYLNLIGPLQLAVEEQLRYTDEKRVRKARKPKEILSNDF